MAHVRPAQDEPGPRTAHSGDDRSRPGDREAVGGPRGVLGLQRLAGNRAVSRLVQRGRLDALQRDGEETGGPAPAGDAPLVSTILAGDQRVADAAHNSPPLRQGEISEGVRRLQRGLEAAGYALPLSTVEGGFDGRYGPETTQAVRRFQQEHGVRPVGGWEAGRKTLHRLDELLVRDQPVPPPPPERLEGLLVPDDAPLGDPKQMRVTDFLTSLRLQVTVEVEALLVGTAFQGKDCPWIRYWFDFYATKPADRVERALKKFGGADTADVTTAVGYMKPVTARIATSVVHWRTTGEVTGIPDGVDPDHPSEPGADRDDVPVLARAGAADGTAADLAAGSAMLAATPGRPLDGDVGVQLASAVGAGSGVRVHTDEPRVSALGARAVTLGSHIAFAPGEYDTDSEVGRAVLAHELAHVAQQRSGAADPAAGADPAVEDDADRAALGAVSRLVSNGRSWLTEVRQEAVPRLRSGLRLSRCGLIKPVPEPREVHGEEADAVAAGAGLEFFRTPEVVRAPQGVDMTVGARSTGPGVGDPVRNLEYFCTKPGEGTAKKVLSVRDRVTFENLPEGHHDVFAVLEVIDTADPDGKARIRAFCDLPGVDVVSRRTFTDEAMGQIKPRSRAEALADLDAQEATLAKGGVADQRFGQAGFVTTTAPNPAAVQPPTHPGFGYRREGTRNPATRSLQWTATWTGAEADWQNTVRKDPRVAPLTEVGRPAGGPPGHKVVLAVGAVDTVTWPDLAVGSTLIECEERNDGGQRLAGQRYLHVVLGAADQKKLDEFRRFKAASATALGQLEDVEPIRAVWIDVRKVKVGPLRLYLGFFAPDRRRGVDTVALVDVTTGAAVSTYKGRNAAAAVDDFVRNNQYPRGHVKLDWRFGRDNDVVEAATTHDDDVKFREWLSQLATAGALAGLAATGVGAPIAATLLLGASAAAGGALAVADLRDELRKSNPDSLKVAVDVATIGASLVSGGAAARSFAAGVAGGTAAMEVAASTATSGGRFFLYAGFSTDAVQAVLVNAEGARQLIALLGDKAIPETKRLEAVVAFLAQLAVTGALLGVSGRGLRAAEANCARVFGRDVAGALSAGAKHQLGNLPEAALQQLRKADRGRLEDIGAFLAKDPTGARRLADRHPDLIGSALLHESLTTTRALEDSLLRTRLGRGPAAAMRGANVFSTTKVPIDVNAFQARALAARERVTLNLFPEGPNAPGRLRGSRTSADFVGVKFEGKVRLVAGGEQGVRVNVRTASPAELENMGAIHGADTGPARVGPFGNDPDVPGQTLVDVFIHENIADADCAALVATELEEIFQRVSRGGINDPNQGIASVMRPGSLPGAPATAHDRSMAKLYVAHLEEFNRGQPDHTLRAQLDALIPSMGLDETVNWNAKSQLLVESLTSPVKDLPPAFLLRELEELRARAGGTFRARFPAAAGAGSLTDELVGHLLTGVFEGGRINGCHTTEAFEQLITNASGRRLVAIETRQGKVGSQTVREWQVWEAPMSAPRPPNEPTLANDNGWTRHGAPKTTSDDVGLMLQDVDEALANWANAGFGGVTQGRFGVQFTAPTANNVPMVGLVEGSTSTKVGTMFYDSGALPAPASPRRVRSP